MREMVAQNDGILSADDGRMQAADGRTGGQAGRRAGGQFASSFKARHPERSEGNMR